MNLIQILGTLDLPVISHNPLLIYLDLKLFKQDDRVIIKLFCKSTATNSLLHFSSFNPKNTKTGVPTWQFLHQICMETSDFFGCGQGLNHEVQKEGVFPTNYISFPESLSQ